MPVYVVSILPQRRSRQFLELALLDPDVGRLGNRDACILGRVHAALHFPCVSISHELAAFCVSKVLMCR
jgi:hypothetical protein